MYAKGSNILTFINFALTPVMARSEGTLQKCERPKDEGHHSQRKGHQALKSFKSLKSSKYSILILKTLKHLKSLKYLKGFKKFESLKSLKTLAVCKMASPGKLPLRGALRQKQLKRKKLNLETNGASKQITSG